MALLGHGIKFMPTLSSLWSLINTSTHHIKYYYSDFVSSGTEFRDACLLYVKQAECLDFLSTILFHTRNYSPGMDYFTVTKHITEIIWQFNLYDNHTDKEDICLISNQWYPAQIIQWNQIPTWVNVLMLPTNYDALNAWNTSHIYDLVSMYQGPS